MRIQKVWPVWLFESQDHNVNSSSAGSVLPDFTELELTSVTREDGVGISFWRHFD